MSLRIVFSRALTSASPETAKDHAHRHAPGFDSATRVRTLCATTFANRLARIVWASGKYERAFDGNWANQAT
jgi:hypothetical protein